MIPKTIVDCDYKYWGDGISNPITDRNPRLQLLIEAVRRGAKVQLLLDSYFDELEDLRTICPTMEYLTAIASAEGLDLAASMY